MRRSGRRQGQADSPFLRSGLKAGPYRLIGFGRARPSGRACEAHLRYNPAILEQGDRTVKLLVVSFALALSTSAFAQSPNGSAVFTDHCATCHAGTDQRVPTVAALRQRTPEAILDALVTGAMRQQGAELSDAERRAVAAFLGGRAPGAPGASASSDGGRCASPAPFDPSQGGSWTGW